jgi:hypothetical protein
MDAFVMLTLVGVGCMVLLYFALPALYFSGIAVTNSTDPGSQARVIATNQTDSITFLVGLGGNGIIWYILLMILAAVFLMVYYYVGRTR